MLLARERLKLLSHQAENSSYCRSSSPSEQNIAVAFAASKKYRSCSGGSKNITVYLSEQTVAVALGNQMVTVALTVTSSHSKLNIAALAVSRTEYHSRNGCSWSRSDELSK
jgi:hypothetical protein